MVQDNHLPTPLPEKQPLTARLSTLLPDELARRWVWATLQEVFGRKVVKYPQLHPVVRALIERVD
jgi:hypothetical protein